MLDISYSIYRTARSIWSHLFYHCYCDLSVLSKNCLVLAISLMRLRESQSVRLNVSRMLTMLKKCVFIGCSRGRTHAWLMCLRFSLALKRVTVWIFNCTWNLICPKVWNDKSIERKLTRSFSYKNSNLLLFFSISDVKCLLQIFLHRGKLNV